MPGVDDYAQLETNKNKKKKPQVIAGSEEGEPFLEDDEMAQHRRLTVEEKQGHIQKLLTIKDSRGFREISDIKSEYKLSRDLGTGSFGSVCLAQHKITET